MQGDKLLSSEQAPAPRQVKWQQDRVEHRELSRVGCVRIRSDVLKTRPALRGIREALNRNVGIGNVVLGGIGIKSQAGSVQGRIDNSDPVMFGQKRLLVSDTCLDVD